VDDTRGYEVTPVLQTTARSGNVEAMLVNFTPSEQISRQLIEDGTVKNLAIIVRGTFDTAFPDGEPGADPDAETGSQSLKTSATPVTLFLVADTDWLLDMTSVRRIGMINAYMPLNDNLAFAGNSLDFLGGSEDLISIRGKGSKKRDFEVIRRMEAAAQENFEAEQVRLEDRQRELQKKISELLANQSQSGQLVASSDLQEAIAGYRTEEAEVRAALREIKRALRHDIKVLENVLTAVNLLIIPLILLPAGIFFILSRHNRQKKA
jgi:ABC-type uncharacterized transport system involved in gliding motility auxiliary subunit